jgi:hypothetical protein
MLETVHTGVLRENERTSRASCRWIGLLTTETKILQRPAEEIAGLQ